MLSMILAAALAEATPTPLLEPNGPWVVEAEENVCLLSRSYGQEPRKVTVALQPIFTRESVELITLTPDTSSAQQVGKALIGFDSPNKNIDGTYFSVRLTDGKRRFTRVTVGEDIFDELKTAKEMTFRAKPVDLRLHIVRFAKAMPAFAKCQDDLLRSWGVDPDEQKRVSATVRGNPARYFGDDAYPVEALRKGAYGRVIAVLNIDPAGAVSKCRAVVSAGKELDDATCKTAAKITFDPAKGADGKPIASIYVLPVRWSIPGAPTPWN